jgi:FkbM family methyltransferase
MTTRLEKHLARLLALLSTEDYLTLADVGSMGGTEPEWKPLENHARVRHIGFEPDVREFGKLTSDARHCYFNQALYSRAQEPLELYVSQEAGKTSVLPPNMDLLKQFPFAERYQTRERVQLAPHQVSTLDTLLKESALAPDFIKLDTQGSEKFILEGGRNLLKESVLGLKVEVEFLELYKGQPMFSDLDPFLRSCGFELIDLRRVFWKKSVNRTVQGKGQLAFGDALYLKSPLSVLLPAQGLARPLKFLIICLVYGCLDPARAVLEALYRQPHIPREDLDAIDQVFEETARGLNRFRLPGSRSLSHWLLRALRFLNRSERGFADSDSNLGNRWLY